jgi:hypothetical protein
MLKHLAIFWMFLIVLCADCGAHQVQAKDNRQKPAAPVLTVPQQQDNGAPLNGEKQKDIHADVKIVNPPQKDFYDKSPVWMNLALVIVALGTGVVIGWQAWETRRAATGAEGAAEAALAQIEMVKDKERAHFSIEFMEPRFTYDNKVDGYPIHFRVTMDGSTRAQVINDRIVAYIGDGPEDRAYWVPLGLPQTFRPEDSPFDGFTLIRTSDDIPDVETDAGRIKMVREKKLRVFVNGRVWYRDLFGEEWEMGFDRGWSIWDYYGGEDTRAGIWSKNSNEEGDYHQKAQQPTKAN